MKRTAHHKTTRWGVPILAAFALLLGVAYFSTVDAPSGTPITDIVDNTNTFAGKTVSVTGEVDSMVSSQAMVMDQERTVIGDEVLVLSQQPLEPVGGGGTNTLFDEGSNVETTGEVRIFHRQELEKELGLMLDRATYDAWEGKPVIVATTVTRTED